ncbi:MAG TPA: sugar ABC transporter ATP-binding protein [Phycisphaerales bacterium]|nr:sugar ABC transporter ATP-binding protein [Phycisphaerales bacterium]
MGQPAGHSDRVLLGVRNVSKRFGSTQALSDVSVDFFSGEVHALMGENGAGKSTLGKAIAGLHKPDAGSITIAGRTLKPGSLEDAYSAGVRIVHQELEQCPNLSVAENLCLSDVPTRQFGLVDFQAMTEQASTLVHRLDPSIDVTRPLGELSPGRRQICQIASALEEGAGGISSPKVIVFDEPTSSLSISEADRLLDIIRELAHSGITIIYVSHRMGEIFAVCDRVTVLRDGQFVSTNVVSEIDEPTLVEQMIGRRLGDEDPQPTHSPGGEARALGKLADIDPDRPTATGKVMLSVHEMSSPGKLHNISFEVRSGEVLGIGGLVGAGRSELLCAIFGLDPKASATMTLDGQEIPIGNIRASIAAGMGFVPEDRRHEGLFFNLGVDENIVLPAMPQMANWKVPFGLRNAAAECKLVTNRLERFQVKTASLTSKPSELSGGNQQKLLIARWMGEKTKVLLLDEPTRGIDVGTKAEVYRLIRQAAAQGLAVVFVSSEMPELLAISDRIMVLAEGACTGTLTGEDMTQRNILTLATRE